MPGRLIGSVAFGTVLQPLNSSMIAVALVTIAAVFHAGSSVNWLVSALYLATAIAAPTFGRLADVFGARRIFVLGLGLITVASVASCFAPDLGVLVACRVVLGLGTGAQYPCGVAMVRSAARQLRARPTSALASLSICSQVTVALGPTLGGLMVGLLDWQGIFLVNLPMVVIAAFAVHRWAPADEPRRAGRGVLARIDPLGLALFAATMTTLMFFLLSLADRPRWWWLAGTVPCTALLVRWERRAGEPFLDLRLLANRALTYTYLRTAVTYTAFYSVFYGMPQWLESARGLTPTESGLVILPTAAVGVLSTALASRLERWRGPRASLLVGTTALALGGLLLTLPGRGTPILALLGIAAMLGLPNGFNSLGNQTSTYAAAPAEQTGAASGLYRTAQYVGANLAAALLAVLFGGPAGDAGLHRTGLAIAVISAALLIAAIFSRSLRRTPLSAD